jgi:hypothetical protein
MYYLALDTDVWLKIIKEGNEDDEKNIFDELIFWIESKHIICLLPENVKKEWERNIEKKVKEVTNALYQLHKAHKDIFKGHTALDTIYQPENFESFIRRRIDRVNYIFQNNCEIASIDDHILLESSKRNLNCSAPNHNKDSFRDTVNILSLIKYLKAKKYSNCFFVTCNYTDYSQGKNDKHRLHDHLTTLFQQANIEYVYDTEKLFGQILRPNLPSYLEYLKEKKRVEEEQQLKEDSRKENVIAAENIDEEFLENSRYIDAVVSKKKPTSFEKAIILQLIESHENYRKYYFSKLGLNGVV